MRDVAEIFIIITLLITIIYLLKDRRERKAELKTLIYIDSLTGTLNMNHFTVAAKKILEKNKKEQFALICSDIERFDFVNEAFGYRIGDEIICELANIFTERVQEDEIFARVSGDNFIALVKYTDKNNLLKRINEINSDFRNSEITYISQCRLSVITGVYVIPSGVNEVSQIISSANIARKSIKGSNEESIAIYDKNLEDKIFNEIQMENRMHKALENKEFKVYYQPKFNISDRTIIGAEALVRWYDPEKGIMSPGKFIPIFEANGFITELDMYVYKRVLCDIRNRIDIGKAVVPVSVNLSRLHGSNENLAAELEELALEKEIDPSLIEFEITESTFSTKTSTMVSQLEILKSKGFKISIDDFGTGFSSLNSIMEFPVDLLKIDKSFIDDIENSDRAKSIIKTIVNAAEALGMGVICEGVENINQAGFLKNIGCNTAQGFLFMRPVTLTEFENALDSTISC